MKQKKKLFTINMKQTKIFFTKNHEKPLRIFSQSSICDERVKCRYLSLQVITTREKRGVNGCNII